MSFINVPSGMAHINADLSNALQGTSGEVSDLNKFVTDADIRNSNARVAYAFHGATEIINLSNTNPTAGQVIIASGPSTASWASLPVIYALSTTAPTQIIAGAVSAIGSSDTSARADHSHAVNVATPVSVSVSNEIGTSQSLSRADHVHAHGEQSNELLHALASQTSHGFLSKTDKAKIDMWHTQGSGSILGAEYTFRDVSVTLSTSYVSYLLYTTAIVEPGDYRYAWSYEVSTSQQNSYATAQIYIDGVLVSEIGTAIPQAIGRAVISGFRYVPSLTAQAHTIELRVKKTGGATVQIHRCDLEFWRKY